MISFANTMISIIPNQAVVVSWSLVANDVVLAEVNIHVYCSRSVSGPWEYLGSVQASTATQFIDRLHPVWIDPEQGMMYKLEARNAIDEILAISDLINGQQPISPLMRRALLEQNRIFNGVNGRKPLTSIRCTIYQRIKTGARCPLCTDPATGSTITQTCPACVGTGISRGYYDPVICNIQRDPPAKVRHFDGVKYQSDTSPRMAMLSSPIVSIDDVVVEGTASGRVWRITDVIPAYEGHTIIFQSAGLTPVDPGHPICLYLHHLDQGGRSPSE